MKKSLTFFKFFVMIFSDTAPIKNGGNKILCQIQKYIPSFFMKLKS